MRSRLACALGLCALSLVGGWTRPHGLTEVREIRSYDHGSYTRVVIELSGEAPYEVHTLARPPRLYVDLEHTWIESRDRAPRTMAGPAPLRVIRGGQNRRDRARVVLELAPGSGRHRTFRLRAPFRVVVDVFNEAPRRHEAETRDGEGPKSFDRREVRRIAIDPGHGGKDPGAIGVGGLYEKRVVLAIARRLRERLLRDGFQVMLTRDGDRFLPLEERTARAARFGADLFVSIHANASRRRATRGAETYLLDTRYDHQTARVAARENGTSVDEVNDLQLILASLRLGYNERFAARLADHVQAGLVRSLRRLRPSTQDLGVKRGPFLVLFMADMPAVLVEVGFVSNRSEAKQMRTREFARRAADGIRRGILAYRDEHARRLLAER
ncbi:MAG: N-acetylmuramoyl-L-alanine amidase [Myxococcota bacterium]